MKVACTVWSGGKSGDNFKGLPIAIGREVAGDQTVDGWWWRGADWYDTDSHAFYLVLINHFI